MHELETKARTIWHPPEDSVAKVMLTNFLEKGQAITAAINLSLIKKKEWLQNDAALSAEKGSRRIWRRSEDTAAVKSSRPRC